MLTIERRRTIDPELPYFLPPMTSGADRSWLIHLHAAVFVGWVVLLLIQSLAISLGNTRFHRRFGIARMAYAVLVFLLGLIVSIAVPVAGATAGDFPSKIAGLVAVYSITDMLDGRRRCSYRLEST